MNDMKKTQRSDPVLLVKDRVARILLAIDIGSSSVRCSAYTFGSARDSSSGANDEESGPVSPVLVPGCAIKIKSKIVGDHCGRADARQVVQLADQALDDCIRCATGSVASVSLFSTAQCSRASCGCNQWHVCAHTHKR